MARLEYLAGLRQQDGRYHHWGLQKVHGEEEAQQALAEAHREITAEVLRQPLPRLYDELESVTRMLASRASELLPPDTDPLERQHFSLIWGVMASVARRRKSRLPAA